jgi:hypothetical protein
VLASQRLDRVGRLQDVVVDGVVGDVLAAALLVGAAQADDRRLAREVRRDVANQTVERVGLDDEREVRETLVGAQGATAC